MKKKISVIGMGSWGTTIAILLAEKGNEVLGWEWISERAVQMQKKRENTIFLPHCPFPETLTVTDDLDRAAAFSDLLVIAVPSHVVRSTLSHISVDLTNTSIVTLTKGIEIDSLMRISEVVANTTNLSCGHIAALAGPTHAEEVSKHLPATIVAACTNEIFAKQIQKLFSTDYFRVYTSCDIIGVELGAALKNVIAIGAGISDGMEMGDNAKAALITRGLREITRLGVKCGASPHTFSGVSGVGDLIVTCGSKHSRNRYVGEKLAQGNTLSNILDKMEMVAEGVKTTDAAFRLGKKLGVDLPITTIIHRILFENLSPAEGLQLLMTRSFKSEDEF